MEQENARIMADMEQISKKNEMFQQRIHELEQELSDAGTHQQSLRLRELRSMIDELKKRSKQSSLELAHWKKLAMAKDTFQ
jgi:cell division septum initiation protein DivIVA